jgi:hypothetical protein
MWGWIIAGIELLIIMGMSYTLWRVMQRAFLLDEVVQYIANDVEINLMHFGKMLNSNVLSNDPEVVAAHKNMVIMAQRLNEIFTRMEESTGLHLRPDTRPPRPKVV